MRQETYGHPSSIWASPLPEKDKTEIGQPEENLTAKQNDTAMYLSKVLKT